MEGWDTIHAGSDNSDEQRRQPPIRWRRVAWRTSRARFDGMQQHLRASGVSFQGPVDHGMALSVYFSDPDGNPLEITCDQ